MRIDQFLQPDLAVVGELAGHAEEAGYEGLWVSETGHDPFLAALEAIEHTAEASVGTAVAIAFARSPMVTAYSAWDLQARSGGRFVLGLGTQIKPHIERRYSMPWSRPVARMREYVLALRAIFAAWGEGSALAFRGEFYTHTLMTPMFSPASPGLGAPPVYLAAVGDAMLGLVGELADGLLVHPFTTQRYLEEVTLPAVTRGLERAGRRREQCCVVAMPIVVTGADDSEMAESATAARRRLAFYGSTPAYRSVLELHGWGELQGKLNALSKRGEWEQMGELIDDELLEAFAVVAEPQRVAAAVAARFGSHCDRVALSTAARGAFDATGEIAAARRRERA